MNDPQLQERELIASQRIPGLERRVAELEAANKRLERENGELALQLYREMDTPPVVVPESFERACARVEDELRGLNAHAVVVTAKDGAHVNYVDISGPGESCICIGGETLVDAIEQVRARARRKTEEA